MATHSGHEGLVKIGANTIAEITSFSYEETAATIDDTELSDTATTMIAGQTSWSASIEGHWDETDTNGQVAMTIGASVTLGLYPEGDTSGDKYRSGTGIVTSLSVGNSSGSTVSFSASVQGSGSLSSSTVA